MVVAEPYSLREDTHVLLSCGTSRSSGWADNVRLLCLRLRGLSGEFRHWAAVGASWHATLEADRTLTIAGIARLLQTQRVDAVRARNILCVQLISMTKPADETYSPSGSRCGCARRTALRFHPGNQPHSQRHQTKLYQSKPALYCARAN